MIVVRDQQLRLLALAQLIRELQEAARNKTPPPAGFSDQQVEELSALSSAELVRLSEMTEPRVAIQIDAGSLDHGLRQVDYLGKRSRQLEFFIRHGATSNMLTKLFRISSADVTLKRRLFSGTASSLRRPSMPPHPIREAGPAGALSRREQWSYQRKNPGGLDNQPGCSVGQMSPVHSREARLKIIVHQHDREVRSALDHAHAETGQRRHEVVGAGHVDRADPHPAVPEIPLRGTGRQAETRPEGHRRVASGRIGKKDEATLDQPLEGSGDGLGRESGLQGVEDRPEALSGR